VNIFEPSRLAIGGGLSRASHLFLDRAVQEAGARALPALWKRVHVALAEGGADSGVIGAGVLARMELARDRDTGQTKATTREGVE
jgi:glucokinase